MMSEIHNLKTGDNFRFEEGGELCRMDGTIIDHYGHALVLYWLHAMLFGHLSDHTKVII